jgi:glycogen operon protein
MIHVADTADIDAGPFLDSGSPQPLGASITPRGVNFAVFSAHARRVELCLFDAAGHETARIELPSRTGDIWHGLLPAQYGGAGTLYGYRVHGPYQPGEGHRFNPAKLLVDPCATALVGELTWDPALCGAEPDNDWIADERDSAPFVPKCRVVDTAFDWGGVRAPSVPWRDTIIYELHVKGFTQRHPGVPDHLRGKYLGLAHPAVIDHLRKLGVTTVELMPVQAFVSEEFLVRKGLVNYWGYNPLAWFAPDARYAVVDPVVEFKTMVRALHDAGLEVVLDVVFNHTAEGNEGGPTLSLRGFDNLTYYRLVHQNRAHYKNFTGCGNTVSFDDPAVRGLVLDCLRYWSEEMRVDGFRFDLATAVGRDPSGFNQNSPFFTALRSDPTLAYVKMIAEPWDVGPGGYQLGHFPAGWSEWNDRYRDAMRAFWRGDRGLVGAFAERFAGSSDLFRQHARKPTASVNFVTSHDGFTLGDLVSYNERRNEANLENGADGHSHNLSWNCGAEGPTDDPAVKTLRARQVRNFLATLFLSQGVPMLLAGDEMGHTQQGNNNTYCQDNEMAWLDWSLLERNADLVRFVRRLIDLRRSRLWLRRDTFLKGSLRGARAKDVAWLHPSGREMTEADWNDSALRAIAVHMDGAASRAANNGDLLVVCNADHAHVELRLPEPPPGARWQVLFDTSVAASPDHAPRWRGGDVLRIERQSTVLLESVEPGEGGHV